MISELQPSDLGTAPPAAYSLRPDNEAVYSWLRLPGAVAGDVFIWQWRDPSGWLASQSELTLAFSNPAGIWGGMWIRGAVAETLPGRWSVTVLRNDMAVLTEHFSIAQVIECSWLASSNAGWLAITSATSGNGDSELSY